MIQLYTGEGKGKTTAAVGQAVRAAGNGYPVAFAQFMKGRETGEVRLVSAQPRIQVLRSEKDFGFYSSMSGGQKAELTRIHNGILERLIGFAREHSVFMIVLDEITYPVNWGLIDRNRLNDLLAYAQRPLPLRLEAGEAGEGLRPQEGDALGPCWEEPELVLTGRDPAPFLLDSADYVTRMECVRHPYEKGVRARRGIEF